MSSHNSSKASAGLSNLSLAVNLQSNVTLLELSSQGSKIQLSFKVLVLYFISFTHRSEHSPQAKHERSANAKLRGFFNPFTSYSLTQTRMENGLVLFPSVSDSSRWQSCTLSNSMLPPSQRDKLFTLGTFFRYTEVRRLAEISLLISVSQWSL